MDSNNSKAKSDATDGANPVPDTKTDGTHSPGVEKSPILFSKRFTVVLLLFASNITMFLIRNNIYVAVVDMAFQKFVRQGNITIVQPAEYQWDSTTIGTITGLTSYGALLMFMSGLLISKLGGSMSCVLSLMIAGITTVLHPIILRSNFYSFLACRLVTGIFTGFYNAIFSEIFSRWIPQRERVKLTAFCYNGVFIGSTLVHPFCGFIAFNWGWAMIFYITGLIGVTIAFLCLALLKSDPSEDKSVSKTELAYILDGTGDETKQHTSQKVIHPYKDIATSVPIWTLCIAHFAQVWGLGLIVDCFPLFIKDITQKNTKDVAYISAIPNCAAMFILIFAGMLMQYWKNNTNITTTRLHKVVIAIGFTGEIILLLTLMLVSNFTIIMFIIVSTRIFTTLNGLALQLIIIEIAPGHTGMIAGLAGFCSVLGNGLAQTIIGFLTANRSIEEWNHCFILTAAILALAIIMFILFGSSKAQPWSLTSSKDLEGNSNSPDANITTIAK